MSERTESPEERQRRLKAAANRRAYLKRKAAAQEPVVERPEPPPTPPQWAPRAITAEEKLIDGTEPSPAAEDDLSALVATPSEDELPDAHLAERPRRDPYAVQHTGYRHRLAVAHLEEIVGPGIDLLGRTEIPYEELWHRAQAKERRAEAARRKAEAELDRLSLDPH